MGTATALRDNTSAITRPGYTFAGWNTAADGGGDQYANKAQYTMNVASNVTLFAQWTQNQTYPRTLSFDANGGTGTMAPVSCNAVAQNSQCEVVVPANGFTRTGYTFSHWTINGIRDDEEYASGKTLTMAQNYTMVANWTLIADTTAPSVTAFAIQPTATSLVVPVTTFIASENDVSYLLTTSATEPGVNNANWSKTKPANYTFGSAGEKTLYAWVKDDAGNISASRNDTVTITIIPAVNGVCGADNNTCDSGSYADINDSANQSRWSCNGSNG